MGEHVLTNPTTAAESRELRLSVERSLETNFGLMHSELRSINRQLATNGVSASPVSVPGDTATSFVMIPAQPSAPHLVAPKPRSVPIPGLRIPDLPKKLQDWPVEWYTGKMNNTFGTKRGIRRMITQV